MRAYDFEYDDIILSDKGFMICNFNSDNSDTILNGAEIKLTTTPFHNGDINYSLCSEYDSTLTATFQICKNTCDGSSMIITVEEVREMASWLCRKTFHRFKLFDDDYIDIYFEATFNMSRIMKNGNIVGLELEMITNRPFGIVEDEKIIIESNGDKKVENFYSISDEEGYIYPDMKITIKEDGNLRIKNIFTERETIINNCKSGEIIKMNYPIISSSDITHNKNIQNDFNWNFFRIENKFKDKRNLIEISIPCKIEITYSPIAKIGI